MKASDRARRIALGVLFGAQLLGIARARCVEDRYFAWAPLHEVSELRISVVERGVAQSVDAVLVRYGIPRSALAPDRTTIRELNDVDPLLARIERIECARALPAEVAIDLRRNGATERWTVRCGP